MEGGERHHGFVFGRIARTRRLSLHRRRLPRSLAARLRLVKRVAIRGFASIREIMLSVRPGSKVCFGKRRPPMSSQTRGFRILSQE